MRSEQELKTALFGNVKKTSEYGGQRETQPFSVYANPFPVYVAAGYIVYAPTTAGKNYRPSDLEFFVRKNDGTYNKIAVK